MRRKKDQKSSLVEKMRGNKENNVPMNEGMEMEEEEGPRGDRKRQRKK